MTDGANKESTAPETGGVRGLFKLLYTQLTEGCGYPCCLNKYCRSSLNFSLFHLFLFSQLFFFFTTHFILSSIHTKTQTTTRHSPRMWKIQKLQRWLR